MAFARRYKQLQRAYRSREISLAQLTASVRGWINHVRYGDTWGLRRALLTSTLDLIGFCGLIGDTTSPQ